MKKLTLIFICLVILLKNGYCDDVELYAVSKADGQISVINYYPGSGDSLEHILKDNNFVGFPIKRIQTSDLPARSDRKYWRLNDVPIGKKIIVDLAAKQADELDKQTKEERKRSLLKMTPAEYTEAKQLGLVK